MPQTIRDRNRPLTISDLAALQNDPIVGRCVHWEDVGLQVGLHKSDIDTIKRNQHHQIEDCRREMLTQFLRKYSKVSLTLNELCQVVTRVNNYHETKTEEENAEFAVGELVKLLNVWEKRNETIATDLKQLLTELGQEKSEISHKTETWNHHDAEWKQGVLENKKLKIQRSLREGNLKGSPIVKELFRNKEVQLSQVSDQVVECILRRDLTEIELVRLNKMEPDLYKQMKKHLKRTEQLHSEIMTYKKLLEERLQAYDRIETGLETIGIKKEKIEKLTKQLKELKKAVDECTKLQADCEYITQVCEFDLKRWMMEISATKKLLEDNIKQMKDTEREYIQALFALFGLAGGVAVGGTIGTALLPVVGTIVGAGIGGAIGFAWSYAAGNDGRARVERNVRNYGETISKAQAMHSTLKELLCD